MNKTLLLLTAAGIACVPWLKASAAPPDNNLFAMVVSAGAAGCVPGARGHVTISPLGPVENMHVEVFGLPPNAGFDLFVIQVPTAPFGMAWYQGDIQTDSRGTGVGDFVGRFSIETFIVAPGVTAAPTPHRVPPFPDANTNPPTPPVHTYHLGLWFDSAAAAVAAGCANTVTPFNGTHTAGIQVLNTANFPLLRGPLRRLP